MTEEASRRQLERLCLPFIALLPFDIFPMLAGRPITTPFLVFMAVAWFVHVGRFGSRGMVGQGVGWLMVMWVTWCVSTLLGSPVSAISVIPVLSLTAQLVMVAVLVEVLPGLGDRAVVWLTGGVTLMAVWALTLPVTEEQSGRVQVGGVDQNVTSLVLAVGLAGVVYLLMFAGRRPSILNLLQFCVIVVAIVRVGSRTGVAAAVAIVAAALALGAWRLLRARANGFLRGAALLLGVFLVSTYLAASGMIPDRVQEFLDDPLEASDSNRGAIIELYLRFRDEWWIRGVGYGGDSEFLSQRIIGYQNAHSLFWKTWIETGIIGVIIFGLILIIAMFRAWRWSVSAAALMSIPLIAFAITLGGDRVSIFWFVIALALISERPSRDRNPEVRGRSARRRFASGRSQGPGKVSV